MVYLLIETFTIYLLVFFFCLLVKFCTYNNCCPKVYVIYLDIIELFSWHMACQIILNCFLLLLTKKIELL